MKDYKPKKMPMPGCVPGRRGDAFYKWVSSEQKRYFAHAARVNYTVEDLDNLGILTKKPKNEKSANRDIVLQNPTGDEIRGAFFQNGKWYPISGHCQIGIPMDASNILRFIMPPKSTSKIFLRDHGNGEFSAYENSKHSLALASDSEWQGPIEVSRNIGTFFTVLNGTFSQSV